MLFILAAVLVGIVAKMGEKKIVSLITRGAGDMVGPAIVILLARGVSVIMTNTETLDTILNAMEQLVSGASAGVFAILVMLVNIPLAFLIPSSSGHATLTMPPLLAPLGDFAGVSRALVITAFQMGHGLMLMVAPTNVVVVGGLAMAKVGYDKFLRFVWPLLLINFVIVVVVIGAGSGIRVVQAWWGLACRRLQTVGCTRPTTPHRREPDCCRPPSSQAAPSISSRTMSAWPACRWISVTT